MNEANEQATKLETAQSDLKQLMADVTRAMEKAQEAVARDNLHGCGHHSGYGNHEYVELATFRRKIRGLGSCAELAG